MQKLVSILLIICIILSLGACSPNSSSTTKEAASKNINDDTAEDTPKKPALSRGSFEYEDEYTRQHLEFIDSADYQTYFKSISGGLAGLVGRSYEDAKLNRINGFWTTISNTAEFVDSGKVELVNEYELLVTELMLNSDSQAAFNATFEQKSYDFLLDCMAQFQELLAIPDKFSDILTGDELKQLETIAAGLDGLIAPLKATTTKPTSELFTEALSGLKELLNVDFIQNNQKFITTLGDYLGTACNVSNFAADTVNDCITHYITYQAMVQASKEWEKNWEDISSKARSLASTESDTIGSYAKIADCIDRNLENTRSYRESELMSTLTNLSEDATINAIQEFGSVLWETATGCYPTAKIVLSGLSLGVAAGNCLTNMNDIAYYGQMLIGYGSIANCAHEVMVTQEVLLRSGKSYQNALMFDSIFHIYKQIQISAADCTIHYCTAIASAPLGYIFKNTSSDEIAASYQVLAHKADLSPIRCHGIQQIYNNGRYVVKYAGNVYFFRTTSQSFSSTGLLGNFGFNSDVPLDLVCRDSSGKETVLLTTTVSGRNIYICGNKLFFQKGEWWNSISLNGGKVTQETQNSIIKYLPTEGMLLLKNYETNKYYATDFTGNTLEDYPHSSEYTVIATHNDQTYTWSLVDGFGFRLFKFYRVSPDGISTWLGDAKIEADSGSYGTIGDICIGISGIYVSVGQMGGTGLFFGGGTLYKIPFDGDKIITLTDGIEGEDMYLAQDAQGEYLYYTTQSYSGVGVYEGSIDSGVNRINLTTMEITPSDFTFRSSGVAYIENGELKILTDNQPTPTILLSRDTLSSLGYEKLGVFDNDSVIYDQWCQLVDDTYYVMITKMVPDDDSSMGWRQGYRRVQSTLYSISPDSTPEKIFSY